MRRYVLTAALVAICAAGAFAQSQQLATSAHDKTDALLQQGINDSLQPSSWWVEQRKFMDKLEADNEQSREYMKNLQPSAPIIFHQDKKRR